MSFGIPTSGAAGDPARDTVPADVSGVPAAQQNVPGNTYWGRVYDDCPDFQLALVDGAELVAELHSVPTLRAFESGREPDVDRVPELLAPLYVRDGRGHHAEPNVWLPHGVPG
jgi:hypothetical protein